MNFILTWKPDIWYTTVVRCWIVGNHTYYAYFVRDGSNGYWRHLVTMDVAAQNAFIPGGNDSFIEDWLATGTNAREINLRRMWRYADGKWYPATGGRYSVNANDIVEGGRSYNYRTNWDGGIKEDSTGKYYYMIAGGASTKPSCANGSSFSIPASTETKPAYKPFCTSSLKVTFTNTLLLVSWVRDSTTVPLLTYKLEVFSDSLCSGNALVSVSKTQPKQSCDSLNISSIVPFTKQYYLRMSTIDILANNTKEKVVPFGAATNTISTQSKVNNSATMHFDSKGRLVVTIAKNGMYSCAVYSVNGSKIIDHILQLSKGIQTIDMMQKCPAGTYIITFSKTQGITEKCVIYYSGR